MKYFFGYEGKKVIITGAASGMGQAAAQLLIELKAEVYAIDAKEVIVPVHRYLPGNLAKKESIDAAIEQLPEDIDRIFTCAGVAGLPFSPVETVMINFVGHRYLIERVLPRLVDGGAIAMIASIGGMGWQMNLKTILEFLAISGFDEARAWLESNQENPKAIGGPSQYNRPYVFSKECLVTYAKQKAWELAKRKIRINTLSPGTTATSMAPEFDKIGGQGSSDGAMSPIGRFATPEEQAQSLVFLNSNMAGYISGADLVADYGSTGAVMTGQVKFGAGGRVS